MHNIFYTEEQVTAHWPLSFHVRMDLGQVVGVLCVWVCVPAQRRWIKQNTQSVPIQNVKNVTSLELCNEISHLLFCGTVRVVM